VPTYLLTIAYEGTCYAGWQRQVGQDTIQAQLERAFAAVGRPDVHVEGSGRTDSGVHATGQCASVVLDRPFPPERLHLALNSHLPRDIAVQRVRPVPDGFHARFHAHGKRYVYRCVVSTTRPAIGRQLYHWVRRPVDLQAMRCAVQLFRGKHDFASFATNPGYPRKRGTVRTVQHAHLLRRAEGFDFAVQGDGFLYNMVRTMMGSLLEVGYGLHQPEWITELLSARERSQAAATAPAAGLYLVRVLYARDWSPRPPHAIPGAEG